MEVLLQQCSNSLTTLKDTLPFPYNYFAAFMLICIIGYFFKLTFKYILSPSVWIRAYRQHPKENFGMSALGQTAAQQQQALPPTEDRLSGDNLKMLLNVISSAVPAQQASAQSKLPAVSGVEDIREAIEAGQPSQSSSANTSTSSNTPEKSTPTITSITNNNNNSSSNTEKLISDKTQVLLEDVPDDT